MNPPLIDLPPAYIRPADALPINSVPVIAIFKDHSLFSDAIEWDTDGPYSHAAIVTSYDATTKAGTVLEFFPGVGGRPRTLAAPDWAPADLFTVPLLTETGWETALKWGLAQMGLPYCWEGIFRFLTRQQSPPSKPGMFCSWFAFDFIGASGVELLRCPGWKVSPNRLSETPLIVPFTSSVS